MKILIAALEIAAAFFAMHRTKARRAEDFALAAPAVGPLIFWLALYAAWMLGSNYVWDWRGPWDFTVWKQASLLHDAGRVLAVGLLGPIGEELIFRGFFYRIIERTKGGAAVAVAATAVVWACLHIQESWQVILLFVVDGILLGLARRQAKSVWVPAAMHILWNLYAVW